MISQRVKIGDDEVFVSGDIEFVNWTLVQFYEIRRIRAKAQRDFERQQQIGNLLTERDSLKSRIKYVDARLRATGTFA